MRSLLFFFLLSLPCLADNPRIGRITTPTPTIPGESTASATVTLVESQHVLTAAHAICDITQLNVELNGSKYDAELVAMDLYEDWAVLRLDRPTGVIPFSVATREPAKDESLVSYGWTHAGFATKWLRYNGKNLSGSIQMGMSGGPVLTRDGKLIGLCNARRTDVDISYSYSIGKVERILRWVGSDERNKLVPPRR